MVYDPQISHTRVNGRYSQLSALANPNCDKISIIYISQSNALVKVGQNDRNWIFYRKKSTRICKSWSQVDCKSKLLLFFMMKLDISLAMKTPSPTNLHWLLLVINCAQPLNVYGQISAFKASTRAARNLGHIACRQAGWQTSTMAAKLWRLHSMSHVYWTEKMYAHGKDRAQSESSVEIGFLFVIQWSAQWPCRPCEKTYKKPTVGTSHALLNISHTRPCSLFKAIHVKAQYHS